MTTVVSPSPMVRAVVCFIAAIGFAFDTYELLMLTLIVRPALAELAGAMPGTPEFERWVAALFFVPALAGGVFGLLGGWMSDVWGRRRVLTFSILLYAFSALAAGFSTSPEMLLFFRTTTFVGVCVEFVAATAWLAELFPEAKTRERVLGYTQAFASVGGILVTGANILAQQFGAMLPAIHGGHEAWRYTLISGVIPAIPLILVRPFLPESPLWLANREAIRAKRPRLRELFAPQLRRTTIISTLLVACGYAIAFGALQHTPRIVPDLPEIKAANADLPVPQRKQAEQRAAAEINGFQEIGGLVGRILLAVLAVRIVSRRALLWLFQFPALLIIPLVYIYPARDNFELLKWGVFVAGMLTVGQFSFWGNYLPRAFPTRLRGAGESFAANIGGRVLGTSAALVTGFLTTRMPGQSTALAAAAVAATVCLLGVVLTAWLPEPEGDALPE
jgi:nitrate/nitrite transporter NarK